MIKELVLSLFVWISAQTGHNVNIPIPEIRFVTSERLVEIWELNNGPSTSLKVRAMYFQRRTSPFGILYLSLDLDFENVSDREYLMHELFHHVVHVNRIEFSCPGEEEAAAFSLGRAFWAEQGLPDPFEQRDQLIEENGRCK